MAKRIGSEEPICYFLLRGITTLSSDQTAKDWRCAVRAENLTFLPETTTSPVDVFAFT